MTAVTRIAVVDDEESLRETLGIAFRREGWAVETYSDGAAACTALLGHEGGNGSGGVASLLPDALVLDILLPRIDGLEVLRRLRAGRARALPVLLLSSKGEEFDRVLGLELGADDYLAKPFSVRELVARVRALVRRRELHTEAAADAVALVHGVLTLDLEKFRATAAQTVVPLTATEFLLLADLIRRPGRVRTRRQLLDAAYPNDRFVAERTIDSHVKRLRRKLAEAGAGDPVEAVYGVGYRIGGDEV